VSDAFDPEQNITAGAHYLRDLMARFGNDLELALAAYNAGEDAVERYGRSIPPFSETRLYVPNVMRVYRKLLAQQRSS
jgi:soluble lytic murein transglycosylase-like protein